MKRIKISFISLTSEKNYFANGRTLIPTPTVWLNAVGQKKAPPHPFAITTNIITNNFTVSRAFGIPQIIYISLVYIIGTNIETKEKKYRTNIHRTESRHIH